jgi:hypothetical protein
MSEEKHVSPKLSWISTVRDKGPWVIQEHGSVVLPPNEQKSNSNLTAKEVLQERAEPVGKSLAFPLNVGGDDPTGGIT